VKFSWGSEPIEERYGPSDPHGIGAYDVVNNASKRILAIDVTYIASRRNKHYDYQQDRPRGKLGYDGISITLGSVFWM